MSSTDARCTARRYYAAHGRDFRADLDALTANPRGVALLMPELVALLKPVSVSAPGTWGDLAESPERADAWYIHLLCGDMRLAGRLATGLPHLPWAVFQRGARSATCHACPWSRLLLRLNH